MSKPPTATRPDPPIERVARLAWVFSYVVPLVLVALLCMAKSADATPIGTAVASAVEDEVEDALGPEDCEMDEEGFVYCEGLEEDEEEAGGEGDLPPEECVLRSAKARAFTFASGDKLRLVLRYTAVEPSNVSIEYRLKGGRGTLNLGKVRRHFGKRGLFQITESLTDAGMNVAQAARNFFIKLDFPDAPGYCNRYYTRQLTAQKATQSQIVWLQSGSVFGG